MTLLPQHKKLIDGSAISSNVAQARGYRSVTKKSELEERGFSKRQCRVPALLIPIYDARGEIALYQARPDEPRIKDGKPIKYETPRGARMALDVPKAAREKLDDPSVPFSSPRGCAKPTPPSVTTFAVSRSWESGIGVAPTSWEEGPRCRIGRTSP